MRRVEIVGLPTVELLALITDLWDSNPDAELPLQSAQREELQRRLATFESDLNHGVSLPSRVPNCFRQLRKVRGIFNPAARTEHTEVH